METQQDKHEKEINDTEVDIKNGMNIEQERTQELNLDEEFNFQNGKQLKRLWSKAYLASKVIKKIKVNMRLLNTQKLLQLTERGKICSLNEQLLQMIKQQVRRIPTLDKSAVSEIYHFFSKKGVKIDPTFKEPRVIEGLNHFKNFTFYPTYFITGVIFFEIMNLDHLGGQITAHRGSSKSTSFMLFSLLSDIINQFVFKASNQTKINNTLKEKILSCPKLIYTIFQSNQSNSPVESIRTPIQSQLKEITKEMTSKSSEFVLLNEKPFSQFYLQKGIRLVVAIDRIDDFVSQCKNYRRKQEELGSVRQNTEKQIQQKNRSFYILLLKIRNKVGKIVCISTLKIQRSVPEFKKLYPQDRYCPIDRREIAFTRSIFEDLRRYQTVDFYLSFVQEQMQLDFREMGRKPDQNAKYLVQRKDNGMKQIRDFLIEYLKSLSIRKYFLSFSHIIDSFRTKFGKIPKFLWRFYCSKQWNKK